jgi:hypothetical protein
MSCSTFEEHFQRLKLVCSQLSEAGLKVNANKSYFAISEIEYLGYWITRNGIQPLLHFPTLLPIIQSHQPCLVSDLFLVQVFDVLAGTVLPNPYLWQHYSKKVSFMFSSSFP